MARRSSRPVLHLKAYNVVRCPHCHFVQGIRKTASCKSCGRNLDSSKLRVLGSTNRVTDVPILVRQIKESLAKS